MLKTIDFLLGPTRSFMLVIGGIFFAWICVKIGFEEFQHRNLVEVPLGEYLNMDPKPKWVKLTGCRMNIEESCFVDNRAYKLPPVAYVPLRPEESQDQPVRIVLKSRRYLPLVRQLASFEGTPQHEAFKEKHQGELEATIECKGWTDENTEVAEEFKQIGIEVPPVLLVVQEDREPSATVILILLAICAGAVALGCLGFCACVAANDPVE